MLKMKNLKRVFLILLIFPMLAGAQDLSIEELKSNFNDPGAAWRGKPFWSFSVHHG